MSDLNTQKKLNVIYKVLFLLSMILIYFDITLGSNNIINYLMENYQNSISYNIIDLIINYKHVVLFFIVFNFFENFEMMLKFFDTKNKPLH